MTSDALPQLTMQLPSYAPEDPGGWDALLELAERADRCGVDRVVASDHVVFGEHLDEYAKPEHGGRRGGRQPTGPDGHWLEPLTVLAVLAGRTANVRLGTSILIAALRRPVVLAKTAATLDVLSGGRLDLGVGVGWQREEYEAAGLDFDGRGRQLDHTLEVCHALWTHERTSYESAELRFDGIHQMPKPKQVGGVPIWVSGTVNRSSMRRLAQFGTGWITWGDDDDHVEDSIPRMRAAVAEHGRDGREVRVAATFPALRRDDGALDVEPTLERVAQRAAAGVTDFRWKIPLPEDPHEADVRLRELVTAFRSAVGRPYPAA